MPTVRVPDVRQHLPRVLPVVLVLLIGALGLAATRSAGAKAIAVHREDRLKLEQLLATMVGQASYASFQSLEGLLQAQESGGSKPFAAAAGTAQEPQDLERLRGVLTKSADFTYGAAVINMQGDVVVQWSRTGVLPEKTDPGLQPIIAALTIDLGKKIPLSGVLDAGGTPVAALGAPVVLADGAPGMFLALWELRTSASQRYNEGLSEKFGGEGWVVDHRGLAVAAPTAEQVGLPLPLPELLSELGRRDSAIVDTVDGDQESVSAYAGVPGTAWTGVVVEDRDAFQGALESGSRKAQILVLLLLLLAGGGMLGMHRRRETVLQTVASTDELTGVLNRRGWFELAGSELERSRRSGERRTLLFVDLDGLKQVNDVLGHREGDRAISDATTVLAAATGPGDVVGRLGGDEFVILTAPGAQDPAQGVLDALAAHNATTDAPFELRFSLGLETWDPADPCSLEELVRRADAVMYVDKASRPDRRRGVVRVPVPARSAAEELVH